MNQIQVEKAIGEDILNTLSEEWQRLFSVSRCAPFLSWAWIRAWHEKLGAEREIYLLKVYRDNDLIGILPLGLQKKKIFGKLFRQLGFLGEELGGADYLDLIAKDEDKAEIWAKVFEFLQREKGFDSLKLENLAQNSQSALILKSFGENGQKFRFKQINTAVCPQINLKTGWENVLRESKRKDNFKRRLKKLEKMENFEFRSVTDKNEISEAFERFAVLHEKRWEGDGGSEATGLPQLMEFHRSVVNDLAEKQLIRFDEIWVEGTCRASVYGLDDGKTFYYYNAGYDLDWANKSVGLVLIGLSIKAAIERGNSLYDFLRGAENYKFDWANTQESLITITLNRPNLLASLNETLGDLRIFVRDSANFFLPDKTADSLQTILRNWRRGKKNVKHSRTEILTVGK